MTARGLASRVNGARSRGPRTAEGKARSSMNALTHGLTARTAIVLPLVERAEDWSAHLAGFVSAMRPVGAVELELVERMAAITWRLRRVERVEAAMIGGKLLDADSDAAEAAQPHDDGDDLLDADEHRTTLDELRADAATAAEHLAAHRRVWAAPDDEPLAGGDVAVVVHGVEGHVGVTADGALDGWEARTWTRVSLLDALHQTFGEIEQRAARIIALCALDNAINRYADAQRRHARLVAQRQVYWGGEALERYEAHLSKQLALALATLRLVRET